VDSIGQKKNDDNGDAWAMGKDLINWNLKESQGLKKDDSP